VWERLARYFRRRVEVHNPLPIYSDIRNTRGGSEMDQHEYQEKMRAFQDQLKAITKEIQEIADHFADGALKSHPVPYSDPDLQKIREDLLTQSKDALDAMVELHKRFNSAS
jgi:hypothetical protein